MATPAEPRKTPCATCPYRRSVPSGLWDKSEYDKLARYDGDIPEQTAMAVFLCHGADGSVCAGWLGHRDPTEMLAVRIGLMDGRLAESCASYETDVPLFPSGAAAVAHGAAEIERPGPRAAAAIDKLIRSRRAG